MCRNAHTHTHTHSHNVLQKRDGAKPHYLFIVLVTPLLGRNLSIRINRACIVAMEKKKILMPLSLEKDGRHECGFHFEARRVTPPDANKPLWLNAESSMDILRTRKSLFDFFALMKRDLG